MTDDAHRYCKIFLNADSRTVMDLLTVLLGVPFRRRTLTLLDGIVDVVKNPDAGLANDFVGWPTLAEVEAEEHAADASIIAITSRVVTAMWNAGIPAVAACDYEDELPWRGGIERLDGQGRSVRE
jgi:hypothetical protein